MDKSLSSKYAVVCDKKIWLHETSPDASQFDTVLEDAEIHIDEKNNLNISGNKREWNFAFDRLYVEDMKKKPIEAHCEKGFKTLRDLFMYTKKPYVKYWFRYQETSRYEAVMSEWYIIL